jgi:hypothetical protein
VAAAIVFAVGASDAAAQTADSRHSGFWISFGMGGSGLSCLRCEEHDGTNWPGAGGGGYLALGGTVSAKLLIGAEVTVGFIFDIDEPNADGVAPQAGVNLISAIVQYYPTRSGLHVVAGPAIGNASITGGGHLIEAPGFGVLLGVGYDLRIARKYAITPAVRLGQLLSDGASGDDPLDRVPDKPQLWYMGVAITRF